MFNTILVIILTALFSQNFVLVQFLGICPFLGVSKRMGSALSMGVAVTVVMVLATLVTYPLYTLVLLPLEMEYLEILFFIFLIASLVQMLEKLIKKLLPALHRTMGIYLPLITTNCAILGVAELVIGANFYSAIGLDSASAMNLGYALIYALFAGLGFTLAMLLMGALRERAEKLPTPKCLQGFPTAMLIACFMAMAFYVFNYV